MFLPGMDELAQAALLKEQKKFWKTCLGAAAKRNGHFGMASMIFKTKYGTWPPRDFPGMDCPSETRVVAIFPYLDPRRRKK